MNPDLLCGERGVNVVFYKQSIPLDLYYGLVIEDVYLSPKEDLVTVFLSFLSSSSSQLHHSVF